MGQDASKKNLDAALPEWTCPHGCPVTKDPCPHLERLLPRLRQFYWKPLTDRVMLETATTPEPGNMTEREIERFEGILRKYNLSNEAKALLRARFVEGKEWKVIMKEQGFVNLRMAYRYYACVLEELKLKGFAARRSS